MTVKKKSKQKKDKEKNLSKQEEKIEELVKEEVEKGTSTIGQAIENIEKSDKINANPDLIRETVRKSKYRDDLKGTPGRGANKSTSEKISEEKEKAAELASEIAEKEDINSIGKLARAVSARGDVKLTPGAVENLIRKKDSLEELKKEVKSNRGVTSKDELNEKIQEIKQELPEKKDPAEFARYKRKITGELGPRETEKAFKRAIDELEKEQSKKQEKEET